MSYSIKIISRDFQKEIITTDGQNLLESLSFNRIPVTSHCGGIKKCNKCIVKIISGKYSVNYDVSHMKPEGDGYELACCVNVEGDLVIEAPEASSKASILTATDDTDLNLSPLSKVVRVDIGEPTLKNQTSDLARLKDQLKTLMNTQGIFEADADVVRSLAEITSQGVYKFNAVINKNNITGVKKEEDCNNLGVAVDIGTTTVVCYLYDLNNGQRIDLRASLNPQRVFGSDVISRIDACMKDSENLKRLQGMICDEISGMSIEMIDKNGFRPDFITSVTVAGNTTMLHLLLGVNPSKLAVAPFVPVFTSGLTLKSTDLFNISGQCKINLLPSISAYVGADITAGIVASGMYKNEGISILLDIGTNGEIVVGNKDRIVCCSTAAGPAFEGSTLECGMGGVTGAINRIEKSIDGFNYTVIGNTKPSGICGSGVIDAIALMLDCGVIDETGRFDDSQKDPQNVFKTETGMHYMVADESRTQTGKPIMITARDVREIQLAKASIAAGVKILLKHLNISYKDIETVWLAGGFGNFMNVESAVKIGIIPTELKNRVKCIGNAAGAGAIMALLSEELFDVFSVVVARAEYIELSALARFQDELFECLEFS